MRGGSIDGSIGRSIGRSTDGYKCMPFDLPVAPAPHTHIYTHAHAHQQTPMPPPFSPRTHNSYADVRLLKPKASRAESSEMYVLARGFRGGGAGGTDASSSDGGEEG